MASSDINHIVITGNLVRDPELRATTSGTQILNFRLASNHAVKSRQTGEWESVADYVSCVVLGARAEPLSRILSKGRKVCVSGQLRYREWESEGQRHSMHEIRVDEVVLMSAPRDGASQSNGEPAGDAQGFDPQYADYDLPF